MVNNGKLRFRHAEIVLTHERKLKKHEAKWRVSDIFLSMSKHFLVSEPQKTMFKVIVYCF